MLGLMQDQSEPAGYAQAVTRLLPLGQQNEPDVIEDHCNQCEPLHPVERVITLDLYPRYRHFHRRGHLLRPLLGGARAAARSPGLQLCHRASLEMRMTRQRPGRFRARESSIPGGPGWPAVQSAPGVLCPRLSLQFPEPCRPAGGHRAHAPQQQLHAARQCFKTQYGAGQRLPRSLGRFALAISAGLSLSNFLLGFAAFFAEFGDRAGLLFALARESSRALCVVASCSVISTFSCWHRLRVSSASAARSSARFAASPAATPTCSAISWPIADQAGSRPRPLQAFLPARQRGMG